MQYSKDFLINEFKKGKEVRELAKELGCSTATITLLNKKYGISTKEYNPKYLYMNREWLVEQYNVYDTPNEIAKATGYPRTCITRYSIKYGLYDKKYSRKKCNYIDENFFDNIDSEYKSYFLGLIMADGNMYKYKDGRLQFSIKLKITDIEILNAFSDAISFNKNKIRTGTNKRNDTICEFCEIKIYNKHFCETLISHGIVERKSGKELIPNIIPNCFIKDFIRGFIDGDGWVYEKPCIGACSMSKEILLQMQMYFKISLNIEIPIYKNKNIYSIVCQNNEGVCSIIGLIYKDSNIHLDRKYNVSMKIINRSALK